MNVISLDLARMVVCLRSGCYDFLVLMGSIFKRSGWLFIYLIVLLWILLDRWSGSGIFWLKIHWLCLRCLLSCYIFDIECQVYWSLTMVRCFWLQSDDTVSVGHIFLIIAYCHWSRSLSLLGAIHPKGLSNIRHQLLNMMLRKDSVSKEKSFHSGGP